jgi:hypothetical protein
MAFNPQLLNSIFEFNLIRKASLQIIFAHSKISLTTIALLLGISEPQLILSELPLMLYALQLLPFAPPQVT